MPLLFSQSGVNRLAFRLKFIFAGRRLTCIHAVRFTADRTAVSQRGVCVFPKQDHLTIEDQKLLARKLGELTCRPHTSGLYIHPM